MKTTGKNRTTSSRKAADEKAALDFRYGNHWRKNPALYQTVMHEEDTVRHCEHCGRPMNRSEASDFGSLCEDCYMKEYYG